jgi:phospholipase/carboxylesterase
VLSGTLLTPPEWQRLASGRRGLRVLQSHGHNDPILPFERAEQLRHILLEAGMDVEFVPFSGGHGIDGDVVTRLAHLVDRIASP